MFKIGFHLPVAKSMDIWYHNFCCCSRKQTARAQANGRKSQLQKKEQYGRIEFLSQEMSGESSKKIPVANSQRI